LIEREYTRYIAVGEKSLIPIQARE